MMKHKVIHVFVNHWPSRIGGEEKTEPKRVLAAGIVKNSVDQILAADPEARIIIMGDMNDEPFNTSLQQTLRAGDPESGSKLVNLMIPDKLAGQGTYFYSGNWNMLDNVIVSDGLLLDQKFQVESGKAFIFSKDWMTYTNKTGDKTPNRTYVGKKYVAGVSDHFPVYFKLIMK
jgi:endonuclease/exonuclease/phosphatase family metal-dependent hydrolase